jgi:cyclase
MRNSPTISKRIIPVLSTDAAGRLVERVEPRRTERSADLVEAALAYAEAGAREILINGRASPPDTLIPLARELAAAVRLPVTIATEPVTVTQAEAFLTAGVSRIAVQTTALADPDFIAALTGQLGSESLAVLLAARREGEVWRVFQGPQGVATEWDPITWAKVAEAQGAGELIVEPLGGGPDGTPYDLDLLSAVSSAVARPVVAAGAAASLEDLLDALMIGNADAVLLGQLLRSGAVTLASIAEYLGEHGLACV